MKTHQTIAGNAYVVYSKDGCTVTDSTGTLNKEVPAGDFLTIPAPSDALITSDDNALVRKANFKRAALALRVLGGGDKSGLPDGYLQAYFLESNGSQYIDTAIIPTNETGQNIVYFARANSGDLFPAGVNENGLYVFPPTLRTNSAMQNSGFAWGGWSPYGVFSKVSKACARLNYKNNRKAEIESAIITRSDSLGKLTIEAQRSLFLFGANKSGALNHPFRGKIYSYKITQEAVIILNFVAGVSPTGEPCMYDKVSGQPFRNNGSGSFIVGFTLAQARKLGKLAPGSSFTVSLPVGWQEDAGVVEARALAEAHGCVLPVQEYSEGDTAAASTYALRRIWVKRTPDALGAYVDADGSRWHVDWCVDVIGADPESLGYERLRSVDAAVDYWELVPYVDPEAMDEAMGDNGTLEQGDTENTSPETNS